MYSFISGRLVASGPVVAVGKMAGQRCPMMPIRRDLLDAGRWSDQSILEIKRGAYRVVAAHSVHAGTRRSS